jgi:hypothetical protein
MAAAEPGLTLAAADCAHLGKPSTAVADELREMREMRDAELRDRAELAEAVGDELQEVALTAAARKAQPPRRARHVTARRAARRPRRRRRRRCPSLPARGPLPAARRGWTDRPEIG